MSLIIAPMTDLSVSLLWHFLMIVFESPTTSILFNPIEIPNFIACNPAYDSAVNEVAISECMTAFDARISPSSFSTSKPVVDLDDSRSKVASK
ncbi:hypothetical protein ES332_A07G209900v1 [Gossypium tomentosum]|uniref:Uncharacterized protein n=1 Tax=Gossypium tomentosum TaxID=34277 RepID=A0A5D2PV39_GOSTO|nr:hypothetical protein ES332_A07G209900v1 [Gossypium tomentosum]